MKQDKTDYLLIRENTLRESKIKNKFFFPIFAINKKHINEESMVCIHAVCIFRSNWLPGKNKLH